MSSKDEIVLAWEKLETWIDAHVPGLLAPRATDEAVAALGAAFRCAVPAELASSLKRHNGQHQDDGLHRFPLLPGSGDSPRLDERGYYFLRVDGTDGLEAEWNAHLDRCEAAQADAATFDGEVRGPVQAVQASSDWYPFAKDYSGSFLCIDMAPAKGGALGQIIEVREDGPERIVLAPSLAKLITQLAEDLAAGKLVYG